MRGLAKLAPGPGNVALAERPEPAPGREGRRNLCRERRSIGSYVDGGFAPRMLLGVENLHRVPEGLSDCAATLAEPLACVCHCLLEPPVVAPADRVLVIGPGAIGLLHDGRVELEPLVTELVPLAEWERAFDASRAGAGVKYVLDPGA